MRLSTVNVVVFSYPETAHSCSWCYLRSSACNSSGLFDDVSHGHALVQDSQFAVGVGCWGVQPNILEKILKNKFRHEMNKKTKMFEVEVEETCGGVHKDSSILQCPVNISYHRPNVPEERGVRKRFQNSWVWTPTCCHRGCFPSFWIWHIPSQRPPSAPHSPVISMK